MLVQTDPSAIFNWMTEDPRLEIALTDTVIDTDSLLKHSYRPDCGAVLLFLGTTREWTGAEQTSYLEYEAYRDMATAELKRLANAAIEKWDLRRVAIVHRLGVVVIGEASIAVVVASPHRKAAFEAGPWLMDRIKEDVPVWKKRSYAGRTSEVASSDRQTGRTGAR